MILPSKSWRKSLICSKQYYKIYKFFTNLFSSEVFLFEYIMLTIFLAAVILAFIFYHICIINSNKNNINHLNEFLVKDHSRTRLSEIPSIKIINQGCTRNVAPTEKKKDDKNKGCKSNIPSKSKSTDNKMKEISSVSDTIQFMYS